MVRGELDECAVHSHSTRLPHHRPYLQQGSAKGGERKEGERKERERGRSERKEGERKKGERKEGERKEGERKEGKSLEVSRCTSPSREVEVNRHCRITAGVFSMTPPNSLVELPLPVVKGAHTPGLEPA